MIFLAPFLATLLLLLYSTRKALQYKKAFADEHGFEMTWYGREYRSESYKKHWGK